MATTNLSQLPPELWDQITSHLTVARDISHLGQVNKAFHKYIETAGWQSFARAQFPSVLGQSAASWSTRVRSLTTVSRAWDRRAFVARDIQPSGSIRMYPGGDTTDKWPRPTGQTMGFTPQIDAYEQEQKGGIYMDVLAFSAGAQICLRRQTRKVSKGGNLSRRSAWSIYRPLDAREGRDDITSLHLVRANSSTVTDKQDMITGSANGDLHYVRIPFDQGDSSIKTHFSTQGRPVQSASLLQDDSNPPLLTAALGQTQVALYQVDQTQANAVPRSSLDFRTAQPTHDAFESRACRIWTVEMLSQQEIVLGIGLSKTPLAICHIRPSGFDSELIQTIPLRTEDDAMIKNSSVYATMSLSDDRRVFLSGGYDGTVRLHDLRTAQDADAFFSTAHNNSAIYSLLLREQHTLLAGTGQHDTVHVFDLRNSSDYHYSWGAGRSSASERRPYSLFLTADKRAKTRRAASVYSMASSSRESPFVYFGLQDTVMELAATEVVHRHPDPLYYKPWTPHQKRGKTKEWNGWSEHSIKGIARYENDRLYKQMRIADAFTGSTGLQNGHGAQSNDTDVRWHS